MQLLYYIAFTNVCPGLLSFLRLLIWQTHSEVLNGCLLLPLCCVSDFWNILWFIRALSAAMRGCVLLFALMLVVRHGLCKDQGQTSINSLDIMSKYSLVGRTHCFHSSFNFSLTLQSSFQTHCWKQILFLINHME